MPSPAEPSSGSLISGLPYEILQEIFAHCLPQYPLPRPPWITTAAMLLCHICSSWRRLALASPTLWSHLSLCLIVVESNDNWNSTSWKIQFIERDIEFIQWWRTNHGQIAPFLSLDVEMYKHDYVTQKLTGDRTPFLLEYLSSAQYLDADPFYWHLILQKIQTGHSIVFQNLHTVLIKDGLLENPFHELQSVLPHTLPALRRLSINNIADLHHWPLLTHLSLHISLSLTFWLFVIRAVPRLRWGYVVISTITSPPDTDNDIDDTPPQCTLLDLTTLTVSVRGKLHRASIFPFSSLFTDLHLPSLRTLSLSAPGANAWKDVRALREVYSVLRSAPGVTKLVLEDDTLSSDVHTLMLMAPPKTDIVPIWHHAPELAHLQLASPPRMQRNESQYKAVLAHFVRYLFSTDNMWLDLRNPASSIRVVTISNNDPLHPISDLTMASIRESVGKVPKIVLEVTSESAGQVAADARKEWGSRI